jgi:hypothetical protein
MTPTGCQLHMLDQFRQSQCSNPTIVYAALAPLLIGLIVLG